MTRVNTKERILEKSLELFNRDGEPNVTTNRIADELDISPGNLHYHFRTKADLVETLFGHFEHRMLELLSAPEDARPDLEDTWLFLHLAFETISQYRFIYRDLTDLCTQHRWAGLKFRGILKLSLKTAGQICESLSESGQMEASAREKQALIRNIVLTSTFWLAFDTVLEPDQPPRPDRAVWQVMSLVSPHLVGPTREQLRRLSESYL